MSGNVNRCSKNLLTTHKQLWQDSGCLIGQIHNVPSSVANAT